MTLVTGGGAEFSAELEDFEAQAMEFGFGGGEEALDVLVVAVMGRGPVAHLDFEEVV